MQQKAKNIIQLCLIMTKASVLNSVFFCILVQKNQTNCEINSYILWLGSANKYGSLNCQFLKLVPPGFRAQNGKYFPLPVLPMTGLEVIRYLGTFNELIFSGSLDWDRTGIEPPIKIMI